MFQLPKELQNLIYSYDNTYKLHFDLVLKSITKKLVKNFKTKYNFEYVSCMYCNTSVKDMFKHRKSTNHQYNLAIYNNDILYKITINIIKEYFNKHNIKKIYRYQLNWIIEHFLIKIYTQLPHDYKYNIKINYNVVFRLIKANHQF